MVKIPSDSITIPKKLILLLIISTAVRLVLSGLMDLSNDEVYYVLYARFPEWNYFDHPPMTGIAIWLSTINLHFNHEIAYRFPAIAGAAVTTYLLYKTGCRIAGESTGWLASLLYQGSIYGSIISGVFIIPDAVLLPFWIAALYLAIRISDELQHSPTALPKYYILFGICAGLAIFSKLNAVYLWFGIIGYLLSHQRKAFRDPWLYISISISLVFLVPFAWWNITNDFVTYKYHGERVLWNGLHLSSFLRELLGELAYHNPLIWIACFISILHLSSLLVPKWKTGLLLWFSIPLIVTVWCISFSRETLPHWSGPAYLPLLIIAAAYLPSTQSKRWLFLANTGLWLTGIVIIAGILFIHFYPGTIGKNDQLEKGKGDFTLDLVGWKNTGKKISHYLEEKKYNRYSILSPQWFPAAHIDEYIARPAGMQLYGFGKLNDVHQYQWINERRMGIPKTDSFLYICPSNFQRDIQKQYGPYFQDIHVDTIFAQYRSGGIARYFTLYWLLHPADSLPQPIHWK